MKWRVKSLQHGAFSQVSGGDFIKFSFDIGGEIIVNDLREMVGQKVGDQFPTRRWDQFAAGGTRFFLDNVATDFFAVVVQDDDVARLAFAVALFDIAAGLYSVDDSGVGAWTANAEVFELLDQGAFGVAGRWPSEGLAGGDVVGFEGVTGVELWQEFVFAAAIDTQESVKGDDFTFGFKM